MKTYIVYHDGIETYMLNAASHNAAEKKAKNNVKKFMNKPKDVSVAYTEI